MTNPTTDTLQLIASITSFKEEIAECQNDLKVLREQAKDTLENMPEHQVVIELKDQLKAAKEHLRLSLLSDGSYNDLQEKIAEKQKELKEAQFDLSEFLVSYFQQTGERQVELNNEAREVLLSGKLGKEVAGVQTSIFTQPRSELDVGVDRKDLN